MRKTPMAVSACLLVLGGLLAGCGDGSGTAGDSMPSETPGQTPTQSGSSSPSETPSETPSPSPTGLVIDATIRGDDVEPNGERVMAKLGEPITINVDSNRPGELHVHSSPEQELAYRKGKTTLTLTIDTPGVVDVEDHVADKVLVSLQVS